MQRERINAPRALHLEELDVNHTFVLPRGCDPRRATMACPGSLLKIAIMQARHSRGLPVQRLDDVQQLDRGFLVTSLDQLNEFGEFHPPATVTPNDDTEWNEVE